MQILPISQENTKHAKCKTCQTLPKIYILYEYNAYHVYHFIIYYLSWEAVTENACHSLNESQCSAVEHAGNGERTRTVPFYFYSPHLRSLVCCPIGTERVMNRRSMRVRGRVDGLGRLGRVRGCSGLGWRRGSLGGLGDKQERQEVCRTGGWDPRVWERETVWKPGMIGALFQHNFCHHFGK